MYLRITRSSIDPAKASQVAQLAQEVVDSVKQLPGIQHVYQAGNADTGQAVIISIWDTREHAQFDRAALSDIVDRAQHLVATLSAPEIYEVNAHG
jgi:heme-degrading monooxygenase HmoA